MNLGDLRTSFLGLLNRSDCTVAQANTFLGQGMQRLQREIRVPSMERLQVYNSVTATATVLTQVAIPNDFIQPIDILVMNDGSIPGYCPGDLVALDKKSFRELQQISTYCAPTAYGRYQAQFYIRGTVPATMQLHVYYYGEFSPLVDDTSENEIMASSPDLVTYSALALAGDYFEHAKVADWEARYQQYRDQVQAMSVDVDANGGSSSVAPAYGSHGSYGTYGWYY